MKLITNPIENWQQMAGDTELEQKLNALITERMVSHQEIPFDECLSEATMLVTRTESEEAIRDFLVGVFATAMTPDGEQSEVIEKYVPSCEALAKAIMAVQAGQWPPVVES